MKRGFAIALAAVGFALSVALEVVHVLAYVLPNTASFCSVGETLDCATVALSRYSVLFALPVPLWGAVGFLAIGIAALLRSRWFGVLSGAAALASLGLLGVEIVAIGALCLLCEATHLVAFALFGLALWQRREPLVSLTDRRQRLIIFGPSAAVWLLLVLFVPRYWAAFGWKGEPPFAHGKTSEGYPWIGAEEPKLTVHAFTDYRCVHCKAAETRTLTLLSAHSDELRIVRRQFPRQRCPKRANVACIALRLSYCAEEQGKFWQADRWLFSRAGHPGRLDPQSFAKDLAIDLPKLTSCLGRETMVLRAAEEAQFALDQGFKGTPTFVVDGKRVTEQELHRLVTVGH